MVVDGRVIDGANGIGRATRHVPLPWTRNEEFCAPPCWCWRRGRVDS